MRINPVDFLSFLLIRLLKLLDRRQTDLKNFDLAKIKNILVVSSTAIGDTLLSTPAIKSVRERYPDAKIIAHLNIKSMELFETNPHINGIVPYHGGYKKIFSTIAKLRKHRFDIALIFHGNEPQATPMAYLSGARFIIKVPNTSEYRFLLSNKNEIFRWGNFIHGVEQRLKTAELADCKPQSKRMVLPLSKEGAIIAENFLKNNGIKNTDMLIGFQVKASTVSRMWFADRFVELGKRLIESCPGTKAIITGSPEEYAYCKKIADAIGENAVVSAGRIPLRYMPSLLKRFRVLVSGDTGIMHMAIAAGTPVVALFAVADSKKSGPYYDMEKHIVIQKERTCEPCIGKKCKYQKCMENISVDEVYNNLKILFRQK